MEHLEHVGIRRVHGNELSLQMGREFGNLESVLGSRPLEFVAIRLTLRRLRKIHAAPIP